MSISWYYYEYVCVCIANVFVFFPLLLYNTSIDFIL